MPQPSTARIEAVRRATGRWQKDLVDTSTRNRLRRYHDLKAGTLDLTPGQAYGLNARALDQLLADKPVSLSNLFPDVPDGLAAFDDARRRLAAIHKMALTDREEKGIETFFAAIGLATWKVDSGTPPNAPVILVPLAVEATGTAGSDFRIKVAGDAHLNPVLAHILRAEHDIEIDDDEADVAADPPTNLDGFWPLLDRLKESWKALPNLAIEPRVVAAIFSDSTMPLVTDLDQNGEPFAASDVVAAIAGDGDASMALASRISDPQPNQPDIDPPENEFLVLDADSSRHMVINRMLVGESLVTQGQPETGKSQTIANLITARIARGKRVLYVAEKRAAIEAVTQRLEQVGLGHVVMDMHSGVTSGRDFARTLSDSFEHVATIPASDYSALHRRLLERGDSLIANDAALHEPRDPWKLSVFDMRERLLTVPKAARTQLRLSAEAARALDSDGFELLAGEVEEWVNLGGHALAEKHPEWSRSAITTADEAHEAFDLVSDLAYKRLPYARDALFTALDEISLPLPEMVTEWSRTARFLVVASGSRWARMKAEIVSEEYRAVKQALGAPGSMSLTRDKVVDLEERVNALVAGLAAFAQMTGIDDLDGMPHTDLAMTMERMASNRTAVENVPRIRELEARFREAGIRNVIESIGEDIPPEYAACTVEYAWLWRVLDDLEFDDRRIAAFDSNTHFRHSDEFAETNRERRDASPQRVGRLTAETIIATLNSHPEETALVRRETAKKRGHLSVRQLLARAPHVLSALRPCWTMSPILAAEMIPGNLPVFDTVIFNEASQLPLAEAIDSLARAPQTVSADDSRQLPLTSFFGDSADNDDDASEPPQALFPWTEFMAEEPVKPKRRSRKPKSTSPSLFEWAGSRG